MEQGSQSPECSLGWSDFGWKRWVFSGPTAVILSPSPSEVILVGGLLPSPCCSRTYLGSTGKPCSAFWRVDLPQNTGWRFLLGAIQVQGARPLKDADSWPAPRLRLSGPCGRTCDTSQRRGLDATRWAVFSQQRWQRGDLCGLSSLTGFSAGPSAKLLTG